MLKQTHRKSAATSAELLYRISKAMAAVKDGRELLRIIFAETQPVFGFYDIGLTVLDKSGEFYVDWSVFYAEINPSEANLVQREKNIFKIPVDEPLFKHAFARAEKEGKPFIENMTEEFINDFQDFPHLRLEIEYGYKQFLVTTLKFGGETFGLLNFNSLRENHFESCDLELFQAIADLVAVAVSNIQANEEILEQTREKALLLAVSEDIAAVRDKRDLLQTIIGKVKPLFGFYDCGIMILDKDRRRFHDWAVLMPDIDASPVNEVLAEKGFYRDGGILYENSLLQNLIAELEQTGQPIFCDYEKERENFSDGELIAELRKLGYKQGVATLLRTGGEIIGAFFINSFESDFFRREQFGLLQGVADQIAVAVSNVLANEEILERTREKSVLLSISEDIASARNAVELLQIIREKAQRLIPFYDTGILIVEEDGQHHYDLAVNLQGWDDSESNRKLRDLGLHRMVHPDSYVEYVMRLIETANSPVIENYQQRTQEFDYPFFATLQEFGYQEGIGAALKSGGKTFGTLWLNSLEKNSFNPQQFEIFQALADQVAVAVSNIIANEEILEREREKSVLLAITEQIALIRDKNDLFRVIAEKLQPIFGFDETATVLYDKNLEFTQNVKGISLIIRADDALYNQMLSGKTSLKNSPYSRVLRLKTPRINRVAVVAESYPDFIGIKIAQNYGFREFVTMPLIYAEKLLGVFEMYSVTEGKFQPSQIPLYAHLADQIAVAVANILAGEEVEKQLVEIKELKKRLEAENKYLTEEVRKNYNFEEIIGTSPRLIQVFDVIKTVAPTDATVLIQGETGTGKELAARAIHNRSSRRARPLIKLNCAALPSTLVESELFGHERGSFTGATERRIGKFELADKGTIFLDEIGELPLEMQVKLLRVLQEREIERVGGKGTIKLDLRVVAATNRNLAQEVQAGRFRADLYYRLCTVELFMPPMRERREDIEPLTMYFARKYAAKFSRKIERVSPQMLSALLAYDFPGNVRELEHIVEHAVIFSRGEKLILPRPLAGNAAADQIADPIESLDQPARNKKQTLETIERAHILEVLRQTSGRIKGAGGAAEILGLNPATLYFRMKKLGIER